MNRPSVWRANSLLNKFAALASQMPLVCTTALHLLHTDEAGPLVGGPHDWVLLPLLLLPPALLAPGGAEPEFKVAFYAKVGESSW